MIIRSLELMAGEIHIKACRAGMVPSGANDKGCHYQMARWSGN
jgi:hypothetical protein